MGAFAIGLKCTLTAFQYNNEYSKNKSQPPPQERQAWELTTKHWRRKKKKSESKARDGTKRQ